MDGYCESAGCCTRACRLRPGQIAKEFKAIEPTFYEDYEHFVDNKSLHDRPNGLLSMLSVLRRVSGRK